MRYYFKPHKQCPYCDSYDMHVISIQRELALRSANGTIYSTLTTKQCQRCQEQIKIVLTNSVGQPQGNQNTISSPARFGT